VPRIKICNANKGARKANKVLSSSQKGHCNANKAACSSKIAQRKGYKLSVKPTINQ